MKIQMGPRRVFTIVPLYGLAVIGLAGLATAIVWRKSWSSMSSNIVFLSSLVGLVILSGIIPYLIEKRWKELKLSRLTEEE